QCCLPVTSTRSAPEMRFSKLDSRRVDASVYASPGTSRYPAQDSRSRWFATPFLWGSFIPDCTPVYPDDCAYLRAQLCRLSALPSRDRKGAVFSKGSSTESPASDTKRHPHEFLPEPFCFGRIRGLLKLV